MSVKNEYINAMTGEVFTPNIKTKMFKNLDAALDYCRFAEPSSLAIETIYQGIANGVSEIVGYQLTYAGSKGE